MYFIKKKPKPINTDDIIGDVASWVGKDKDNRGALVYFVVKHGDPEYKRIISGNRNLLRKKIKEDIVKSSDVRSVLRSAVIEEALNYYEKLCDYLKGL